MATRKRKTMKRRRRKSRRRGGVEWSIDLTFEKMDTTNPGIKTMFNRMCNIVKDGKFYRGHMLILSSMDPSEYVITFSDKTLSDEPIVLPLNETDQLYFDRQGSAQPEEADILKLKTKLLSETKPDIDVRFMKFKITDPGINSMLNKMCNLVKCGYFYRGSMIKTKHNEYFIMVSDETISDETIPLRLNKTDQLYFDFSDINDDDVFTLKKILMREEFTCEGDNSADREKFITALTVKPKPSLYGRVRNIFTYK